VCTDTCVTVVDASVFFDRLGSVQRANAAKEVANADAMAPDDDALIPDLLVHQLEYADVIVLNKGDLIGSGDLDVVRSAIVEINPRAKLHTTTFAKVRCDRMPRLHQCCDVDCLLLILDS
jgi:G3E family GTPase